MNVFLKHWLKQLTPPMLLRWLTGKAPNGDKWGRPTYSREGAKLPGGHKFYLRSSHADQEVFRQVFMDRDYAFSGFAREAELYEIYANSKDPLIIDAGANIGAASVWFALTFPRATVLAIEPDRENFELLKKNTQSFPLIIPINAALASINGSLYLVDSGRGSWGFHTSSHPSNNSYSVPSVTLDNVMDQAPGKSPFILKIDIEGAEADLFSKPSSQINNFPIISIELHDWMVPGQAGSQNFLKWHASQNRDFLFRGENAFSIDNGVTPRES